MGSDIAVTVAVNGGRVAWVVPNYSNGRPLWRMASNAVMPLVNEGRASANKTDRIIEIDNGGWLGIYSADHPSSILGEAFHLVIGDEAARIPEEVVTDVIEPTLADYNGDAIWISTPKGMNWFYDKWQDGKDRMNEDMASFSAPTSDNPMPAIQEAFRKITERTRAGLYPDRTYRQEWKAEFIQDGTYFQNVSACCTILSPDNPADHPGHTFGMGLDWGKSNDFTSGTIGCRECDRTVDWFRFNSIDYTIQRGRIKQYVDKWPDVRVLPERNSIGGPNIEVLREMGVDIAMGPDNDFGFQTTATTKPTVIEKLYLALQRGKQYPKEYASEFMAYEVETNAMGRATFNAPDGQHDDRVISAALEEYLASTALQVF